MRVCKAGTKSVVLLEWADLMSTADHRQTLIPFPAAAPSAELQTTIVVIAVHQLRRDTEILLKISLCAQCFLI